MVTESVVADLDGDGRDDNLYSEKIILTGVLKWTYGRFHLPYNMIGLMLCLGEDNVVSTWPNLWGGNADIYIRSPEFAGVDEAH